MKKNTLFWITGIILFAVVILFVPSMFIFGRGNWAQDHYGMMGSLGGYGGFGMMGGWAPFGWIIPILILILVVAAGVILGNSISNRNNTINKLDARDCPNCSKSTDDNWNTCPHCSTPLK